MNKHPECPQSNVSKFGGYEPEKYDIRDANLTVRTNEDLLPGKPPCLTQQTIGKYLQPLTRELVEDPPRPSIDELPDKVIDKMVQRDKAFWVDKPGTNAYTLHDAYYNYGMTTKQVKPPHQDVFPRSYQYELECIKYHRLNACDKIPKDIEKSHHSCRPCSVIGKSTESEHKRWKYYPDLTTKLSAEDIRKRMNEVGRPFHNEVCNWYYENYPSEKYNCIMRKFSK